MPKGIFRSMTKLPGSMSSVQTIRERLESGRMVSALCMLSPNASARWPGSPPPPMPTGETTQDDTSQLHAARPRHGARAADRGVMRVPDD